MKDSSFVELPKEPNKELFHSKMREMVNILKKHGVDFKCMNALEMFARAGDWHTSAYANEVKFLEVWEVNKEWVTDLKRNLPNATVKILDSVQTIQTSNDLPKFDLIVIDNPMNLYGPVIDGMSKYCEHFDVIEKIPKIVDDEAILIFNINKKPVNYELWPLWKKRREQFYGTHNTDNLSIDFLFTFYKKLFLKLGFDTLFHIAVNRHEYLDYFAYKIKKRVISY